MKRDMENHPDTDRLVEHVLRGLGGVQPACGLEDRVLAKVRAHAASPSRWQAAFRWRARKTIHSWSIPATAMVALMVAFAFYGRHRVSPTDATLVTHSAMPAGQAIPETAGTTSSTSASYTPPEGFSSTREKNVRQKNVRLKSEPKQAQPAPAPCDCDLLAMQEWHAPSQPAPELPLTHEERLLQHFARRGDTEELAALTPAFRAAENAREQAEFQHFFKKPTNGEIE